MLCSQNSGKYLSGAWHETREQGIEEIGNIPSELLSFYELDGAQLGPNGKRKIFESTMNIGTKPIDPNNYEEKDYDYRCNPEVGR